MLDGSSKKAVLVAENQAECHSAFPILQTNAAASPNANFLHERGLEK